MRPERALKVLCVQKHEQTVGAEIQLCLSNEQNDQHLQMMRRCKVVEGVSANFCSWPAAASPLATVCVYMYVCVHIYVCVYVCVCACMRVC